MIVIPSPIKGLYLISGLVLRFSPWDRSMYPSPFTQLPLLLLPADDVENGASDGGIGDVLAPPADSTAPRGLAVPTDRPGSPLLRDGCIDSGETTAVGKASLLSADGAGSIADRCSGRQKWL